VEVPEPCRVVGLNVHAIPDGVATARVTVPVKP